jgi:hypothetical protein
MLPPLPAFVILIHSFGERVADKEGERMTYSIKNIIMPLKKARYV